MIWCLDDFRVINDKTDVITDFLKAIMLKLQAYGAFVMKYKSS